MSISCQIKVFNSCEQIFKPNQTVRGLIKYTVYEDITVKRIIVSLKGNGVLDLKGKTKRRFKETYVDVDQVLREKFIGFTITPGTYEEEFSFVIPENVPSSIKIEQSNSRHVINCNIQYYIRIKFDRGYLKADKTFKKNINVQSCIVPRLPIESVKYKQAKLFPLKYGFKEMVKIEADIENSVVCAGDKIIINYQIKRDQNVAIDKIETKLVEMYSYKPNRPMINSKKFLDVESTVTAHEPYQNEQTISNSVIIDVPSGLCNLDYSTLVTRGYFVKITAETYNAKKFLNIPVQIGDFTMPSGGEVNLEINHHEVPRVPNETIDYRDAPPSYWEAIGENIPTGNELDLSDNLVNTNVPAYSEVIVSINNRSSPNIWEVMGEITFGDNENDLIHELSDNTSNLIDFTEGDNENISHIDIPPGFWVALGEITPDEDESILIDYFAIYEYTNNFDFDDEDDENDDRGFPQSFWDEIDEIVSTEDEDSALEELAKVWQQAYLMMKLEEFAAMISR